MKKGNTYSWHQIENFANDENYSIQELGGSTIGKSFVTLEHEDRDITISFILDGYNTVMGNQYTCIYSDLN